MFNTFQNRYVTQLTPDEQKAFYKEGRVKTYTDTIREEAMAKARAEARKEAEKFRSKQEQTLSGIADELAKIGVDRETFDRIRKTVAGKFGGAGGEGQENPSGASG